MFLRNVGSYRSHMVSHLRRRHFSPESYFTQANVLTFMNMKLARSLPCSVKHGGMKTVVHIGLLRHMKPQDSPHSQLLSPGHKACLVAALPTAEATTHITPSEV
jgi:hypothetical protein